MVSLDLQLHQGIPGVVTDNYVTAQAASDLTGYNIQYIRRLCYAGKLKAIRIGRSWLIRAESLEWYLNVVVPSGDGRFGPRGNGHSNKETHENASA